MIVWLYSAVNPSYHEVKLALWYQSWFLTEHVCTAAAGSDQVNQGKQSKQAHLFPFLSVLMVNKQVANEKPPQPLTHRTSNKKRISAAHVHVQLLQTQTPWWSLSVVIKWRNFIKSFQWFGIQCFFLLELRFLRDKYSVIVELLMES